MDKEHHAPLSQNKPTQHTSRKSVWMFLGFVLLLLGVAGIMVMTNQKQIQYMEDQWKAHQQNLSKLEVRSDTLKSQLAALQDQLKVQQDHLNQLDGLKQLNAEKLLESSMVQVQKSQVVIDLIYLAQQYLLLQRNVPSALRALQLAKEQLGTWAIQPIEVQQEVDALIQALQAVPQPSEVEMIHQLNQMAMRIEVLPLKNPFQKATAMNHVSIRSEPESLSHTSESAQELADQATPRPDFQTRNKWQKFKQKLLYLMRQAIVVRHKPETPIPSQFYLTHHFQLLLLRAQWAIFQHQDTVYQASLAQAFQILQQYFAPNEQNFALMKQIQHLKTISVEPAVPDLSNLIHQLKVLELKQVAKTS